MRGEPITSTLRIARTAGGASIRLSAPSSEIVLSVLVGGSPRFGGQVPPHIYSIPRGDRDGFF
jgi:hypothetical protein